jgi:hypothetical protein
MAVLVAGILVCTRSGDGHGSDMRGAGTAGRTDGDVLPGGVPPVPPGAEPAPTGSAVAPSVPEPDAPGGARRPRPAPPASAPPTTPGRAAVVAVAGESCPQTRTSGYYRQGWWKDWYTRAGGGWTGDGCAGQVVSVPMSGSLSEDDPDNVIVWWFRVPAGRSCAIEVFVPGTGYVLDAAGAPATYFVYAATQPSGAPIGQFTADQVHNQGRWVAAGAYRPAGDELAVRMVTRGVDWGPGRTGAHLGVSALRVTC